MDSMMDSMGSIGSTICGMMDSMIGSMIVGKTVR